MVKKEQIMDIHQNHLLVIVVYIKWLKYKIIMFIMLSIKLDIINFIKKFQQNKI
jgi:hypothetical protein